MDEAFWQNRNPAFWGPSGMRALVWGILPSKASPAQKELSRLLHLYRGRKGQLSERGGFDKKERQEESLMGSY